ncbi:MAG: bifunctional 5,10-methylenetetrahydrofolate dehydrogenase/5,10-methenyltetrahydrofolate cyclohydrolase [Planctomycetota bacterium]|nr:bifunctional 5,10-methylenetetrahydrofolate dehydrogenase/5,10-methenyltetrahydrofolate cyclohydrolase [Planctomycetota bacterium]
MSESQRGRIIDGTTIAQEIYRDVDAAIADLNRRGCVPHLVAVQVGQSQATDVYVRKQKELLSDHGIRFTHLQLDQSTDEDALLTHIEAFNRNPTVTGIILTMPLPDEIPAFRVQESIRAEKDVEGVNPTNLGRLVYNRHAVGPCTALAVLRAVESTGVAIAGKNVVIVGHSDIVGKPVGLCLLQELATITTCHVATQNLQQHTLKADILVVAVGKPGLVTREMVKPGAIVIDVGISRLDDGRIVGDVDFDEVAPLSSWISPVPGGIGPITVAMVARNTVLCARKLGTVT